MPTYVPGIDGPEGPLTGALVKKTILEDPTRRAGSDRTEAYQGRMVGWNPRRVEVYHVEHNTLTFTLLVGIQ